MRKLMSQYNRRILIFCLVVVVIAFTSYTFVMRWLLIRQLDADLQDEKDEIVALVTKDHAFPEPSNFRGQIVNYQTISAYQHTKVSTEYMPIRFLKSDPLELHLCRQISFTAQLKGQLYLVKVIRSQDETESLILVLILCSVFIAIALFGGILVYNQYLLRDLWSPFRKMIDQLADFKIRERKPWQSIDSNIIEYDALNTAIGKMTENAIADYNAQKSFTENVSHEIHTPLAIIRSQLELLLQIDHLKETEATQIANALDGTNQLARITSSLLLLTKIENHQYIVTTRLSLNTIVKSCLAQYQSLLQSRNIDVQTAAHAVAWVEMNQALAEILIGNLIRNAIRHNRNDGFVLITIERNKIVLSNSGNPVKSDTKSLFQRYFRESAAPNSFGLGLAIVKEIAKQYQLTIDYKFDHDIHILTLAW